MPNPLTKKTRKNANRRGHIAEWLALIYLILKGYRPLYHRKKSYVGEIDWIFIRGSRIIFIEVKYRHTHIRAKTAISPTQQRRLLAAGRQFMAALTTTKDAYDARFDLIVFNRFFVPRHYRNIFEGF